MSHPAVPSRPPGRPHRRREDDDHGPHLPRPAPHALLPPHRVVHPALLRHGGRTAAGDGAQPPGAREQPPPRDVADPLEGAGPDAEEPRRDGIVRRDRLLLVRGLRLLDRDQQGDRPGQDAGGAPLARQRRLHRPRAQGAGVRRGHDRDAARGDRRDGGRPPPRSGRCGTGRADHDGRGGEHAIPVQQGPGPAQPGLLGPLRGALDAGAGGRGPGRGVMTSGAGDPLAAFDRHRRLLFGVAYQMLGSVADAEDTVQDAWLRWSAADRGAVADERAYLVRVVSRLALDRLRSARAQRETYVGPWLPEPLLTQPAAEDPAAAAGRGGEPYVGTGLPELLLRQPAAVGPAAAAELGEQVSLAVLVVLETLSPV